MPPHESSNDPQNPKSGFAPGTFSVGQLGQIARRAAARAKEIASAELAAPGAVKAAVTNAEPRPHVTVRPRNASDTHSVPGSESWRNGGGEKREISQDASARDFSAPSKPREDRDLVGESLVRAAQQGSQLVIPPGARLTPSARDLAFEKGVTFVTGRYAEPSGPAAPGTGSVRRSARIAVASDHGGFALKDQLMPLLKEMGERPTDLGPGGATPAVDYPDFAALVAAEVSAGRADLGIIVDGAGIGSAIVANKFPGVKAANCWNEASARNAREHNHANVLTLGSGHLDLASARSVIAAFLSTPHGPDRHARRAAKTDSIERTHLRPQQLSSEFDEGR